jgi:hypothetical protein
MTNSAPDFMPVLSDGSHENPSQGACVMEYASILAGEEFTDNPMCSHKNVTHIAQLVNDLLPPDERHRILEHLPRIMNTRIDDLVLSNEVSNALELFDNEWRESMRLKYVHVLAMPAVAASFWTIATYVTPKDYLEHLEKTLDLFDELTGRTPADYRPITEADYKTLREATSV